MSLITLHLRALPCQRYVLPLNAILLRHLLQKRKPILLLVGLAHE